MKIKATLISDKITSNSKEAFDLFASQRFGEKKGEKITYMLSEALYLLEEKKMEIFDSGNKLLTEEEIVRKFKKVDKKFKTKYIVFKDLRKKGYIVKTALKYGAEFRIYDKGVKVESGHSRWICFPVLENQSLTWQEFSAKNRVAHSTKKNLLIAIIDEEEDVSYFEIKWIKT